MRSVRRSRGLGGKKKVACESTRGLLICSVWGQSGQNGQCMEALGKYHVGRRKLLKEVKEQNAMLKTTF